MYLIVGLGNPEEEYRQTRHNMGFDVINKISSKYSIAMDKKKFKSIYGDGMIGTEKVVLLKPQTYMNLSGIAIKAVKDFFKVPNENVIVIYDDMDVEPGKIKIRKKGSGGSHNGMKSVISQLRTTQIPRIRVGIGKPEKSYEMIDYVISKMSNADYDMLKPGIDKAVEAVEEYLVNGIDIAMNKLN